MNSFLNIETEYILASRTIETILVSNSKVQKLFYVYNYEGYSYRVFETLLLLIKFFETNAESDFHFDNEFQLDKYLSNINLANNNF